MVDVAEWLKCVDLRIEKNFKINFLSFLCEDLLLYFCLDFIGILLGLYWDQAKVNCVLNPPWLSPKPKYLFLGIKLKFISCSSHHDYHLNRNICSFQQNPRIKATLFTAVTGPMSNMNISLHLICCTQHHTIGKWDQFC